jgi:hypothetical protein
MMDCIEQLTNENDGGGDLTATFSPDGRQILFHRDVGPTQPLFLMSQNPDGTWTAPAQLTSPPGFNNLANWGQLRVKG